MHHLAIKHFAVGMFVTFDAVATPSAPLLKEEGGMLGFGLTFDIKRPLFFHVTSGTGTNDTSFDIRPTSDFLGELLRHSNGIEVLEPLELREKMRQMIAETLKRY